MQHKNTQKAQVILEILGDILRKERLKQNKSQRLLADEYDIQRSLFCRIEKGLNEPKLISLLTICEALNIKPSELFKQIENKLPKDFSLIEQ